MSALAGQVAVVTGASSGIGAAIAQALAAEGARLCLVGRRSEALQSLTDSLPGPASHRWYFADLCEDGEVAGLASALLRDHAGVDLLVHAAGIFESGTVGPRQPAGLDLQYRTNVRAPLVLTQALLETLRARRGQIVFVNSSAGLVARAQNGGYAATKHALKALADGLREELNPDGVRVLSVYPGRTATPMQARVHAAEGRAYRPELLMQPQDVASVVVHALTLPHSAEVTDIMMRPLLKTH
jgi:NADP-dependent 3-hydroxy acid dehydrogenase YdfG